MKLHLILARSDNNVIGKDGKIPWYVPEDMTHFKEKTLWWPVIMGRKTWESLPATVQPLPYRLNIVLSRNKNLVIEKALTSSSLGEICQSLTPQWDKAWVIGGSQLYAESLPYASTAEVTEIHTHYEGDTFAPQFGDGWVEISRERRTSVSGVDYSFVCYENTNPLPIP